MKNLKKTFLVVLGLSLIVSMTFFGCSKKEASASVASASDTFDLSVCFASEPQTIDPALNSAVDGAVMLQHFFEGLMKWADGGNPATDKGNMNYAKLVNGQAASYEKTVNADGTVTYTF
jgi:oligopeptide transport system substrate-binding protein